jgi:hypothetical protein
MMTMVTDIPSLMRFDIDSLTNRTVLSRSVSLSARITL